MIGFYRKKPVIIEAFQFYMLSPYVGGMDGPAMADYICDNYDCGIPDINAAYIVDDKLMIETLEGTMTADEGDWIIKGVKGEFYPCKPDIFYATYEPVAFEKSES
jgi:hypothetical protein